MYLSPNNKILIALASISFSVFIAFRNAYMVRTSYELGFIPVWGSVKLVVVISLLLLTFSKKVSQKNFKSFTVAGIIFSGIFSWYPMLFTSYNWVFMSFLNLGISLLLLASINSSSDRKALTFIYGNLILQMLYFGAFNKPLIFEFEWSQIPQPASINFNPRGPWHALAIIYTTLGIFTANTIQTQQNLIKLLNETSDIKDQFQAIYNHNIKTPLQTIALESEIIKSKFGAEQHVDTIQKNISIISSRIDALLSRNKDSLDLNRITIKQLLSELKDTFKDNYVEQITDHITPSTEVPKVLLFAIENILENAIKMSSKPPTLEASIQSNQTMSFTVIDQGPGMALETLSNYAKPLISITGGSGIGMYLSLSLLKKISYGIRVESHPGFGTKVEIAHLESLKESTNLKKRILVLK